MWTNQQIGKPPNFTAFTILCPLPVLLRMNSDSACCYTQRQIQGAAVAAAPRGIKKKKNKKGRKKGEKKREREKKERRQKWR